MKLDPRILEGKKPLSCFDVEEAKQFIEKEGYFANSIDEFCDLSEVIDGKLFSVDDSTNIPFDCTDEVGDNYHYSFFLPKEWVQNEPVWKAYDLDTLKEDHIHFGDTVVFRRKTADGSARVITAIYNGKSENSDDLDDSEILLGGEWFGFQQLFDDYEIYDNVYGNSKICKWRPFGYQE